MPVLQTALSSPPCAEVQEEFGMTFTVALIGQSSVIVGADRRHMAFEVDSQETGMRPWQDYDDRKIYLSDDKSVVCAYAGGPQSEPIARIIATESKPNGLSEMAWKTELENLANKISPDPDWRILNEVMCIRPADRLAMTVVRQGQCACYALPIKSQKCAGDRFSLARFLPKHSWREDMTTEELEALARLSVAAAHRENPTGIGGGCDVATISDGNVAFRYYSDLEGSELLKDFGKQVSGAIANLALGRMNKP